MTEINGMCSRVLSVTGMCIKSSYHIRYMNPVSVQTCSRLVMVTRTTSHPCTFHHVIFVHSQWKRDTGLTQISTKWSLWNLAHVTTVDSAGFWSNLMANVGTQANIICIGFELWAKIFLQMSQRKVTILPYTWNRDSATLCSFYYDVHLKQKRSFSALSYRK